jgi:hypothetical protein
LLQDRNILKEVFLQLRWDRKKEKTSGERKKEDINQQSAHVWYYGGNSAIALIFLGMYGRFCWSFVFLTYYHHLGLIFTMGSQHYHCNNSLCGIIGRVETLLKHLNKGLLTDFFQGAE